VLARVHEHASRYRRRETDGDQERDGVSRGHNGHDTAARGCGRSPVVAAKTPTRRCRSLRTARLSARAHAAWTQVSAPDIVREPSAAFREAGGRAPAREPWEARAIQQKPAGSHGRTLRDESW
jgi:hypothetical protein